MSATVRPPRPIPLQGNLPAALTPLTALPNWVCWKWEWRVDKKTRAGKWTKPPHRPDAPHRYAKNNDSRTWGTYEQALAAFEAGQCDGIGSRFASWEDAKAFVKNLKHWIPPGFIKGTGVRRVEVPPNVFLDLNTKQAVPFAERDEAADTLDSDGRAA